eukprot:TRINITY_DN849_c0_g2_i2.p1 TRINITY_DN849_c0_g2~~TRINITY_DN849_c0_g2_i2.p1  ORF type:complete len:194 (+),score=70.96 TRINITY_DN849_c0_g2_i2:92-673(+)
MSQAITAVEEMESLNTNVAKTAFVALSEFYSNSGSPVTYDDASVTDAISTVKDLISDFKDTLTSIKDIFNYALPGFYGLCAAISVLGFFAWFCGASCCSMTMGMLSSGFLILSWLLFAVFWLTGSFLDDTCVTLSNHYYLDCMKQPGYTCPTAKLTDIFQCPKITSVSSYYTCLLYTSPSPRDRTRSRMPSSA